MDIAAPVAFDVEAPGFGGLIATPGTASPRPATINTSRPTDDYSDPVIVLGRLKPGTARESHRVVHAIPLAPDLLDDPVVTARCGASLPADDLQLLPRLAGMPCERCVMTA